MVVAREPAPQLRSTVRQYYGFRETPGAATRRREGPGAEVVVILSFGPVWRIGAAVDPSRPPVTRTSFVGGLHLGSVLTEHDGLAHGMQLSLTPPGAYAFFGVPMHELAGCTVPLDCLLGRDAELLTERLASEPTWAARFRLLETLVARGLRDSSTPTPGVAWAWRRLVETSGCVPIGALVEELGWSPKRLVARFREEIGVPPKALARLLRFERAAAQLVRSDGPSLAAVAAGCGFYDQAHLTNEFRRITGVTPAAYAASQDPETFRQDTLPTLA